MFQRHVKIYITAKRSHAQKFIEIKEEFPDMYFTMRWPVMINIPSERQRPVYQWMGDEKSDILNSDVVIVYGETGDDLNESIFMAGYAHAAGKHIYVIGEHKDYSKWQFYDGAVTRCPTIKAAIASIKIRFRGEQKQAGRGPVHAPIPHGEG